jgi:hypothetical protein
MKTMRSGRRAAMTVAAIVMTTAMAACGMMAMMRGTGAVPPAEKEFGMGPRTSAGGAYVATLEPAAPLAVRRLQSVKVRVSDAHGAALEGATLTLDGGMPQHGHGLPTRPRVLPRGQGDYEIEGLRFSMGGWWELRLGVAGPPGADTITVNVKL